MGYQAPSPDEVYRYALRLDGARSLTDRFGLSILFLNDTSSVCRAFLLEHCVDLCLRTADRIRFIFFSDLPSEEFDHIAHDMQLGRARGMLRNVLDLLRFERPADFGGMLRNVLDLLRFERPADFERNPWRSLRPHAFRPLRSVDEISERLSWECDLRTAMPGAGMAMQFAQRLGIGRYVPCILVFTEIGALHIDVLPIAGLTVPRIYQHVRTWIDEFYEQNHVLIEQWSAIENEITALISRANHDLGEIRAWRHARAREWETLSMLSSAIHAAECGALKEFDALADRLQHASSFSNSTTALLREMVRAVRGSEASKRKATELRSLAGSLSDANTSSEILAALKCSYTRADAVGENLPQLKRNAEALAQRLERPQTPRGFVELWWHSASRQKLSLKLFKRERVRWEHALGLEHSVVYRDELELIRKAVEDTLLCEDAARASTAILRRYAEHLRIDPESEAWRTESEHYRSMLQHSLHRLCSTAPEWLRNRVPSLTIGETFPRVQDLFTTDGLMTALPALQAAIDEETRTASVAIRDDIAKTATMAHTYQDEAQADLEARAKLHDVPEKWPAAFLADALTELRTARRRLELSALSATKANAPRGPEWNEDFAARLHRALDTYDHVASSFRYPHRDDPLLRRVTIRMSLPDAAGIWRSHDEHAPEVRDSTLKEALDAAAASAASLPSIRSEAGAGARASSPSARLARALASTLREDRLSAVLNSLAADTLAAGIDLVVSEGRASHLLRRLTTPEQKGVAEALASEHSEKADADSPVDAALMALGLYTAATTTIATGDAARMLHEKVVADEFDVFMAHNSADKSAIVELGRHLRSVGVYPWIDTEQVPPGRWFQDVIQGVIPRVRAAAVCIGRSGLGRWQALELRTFITSCVERGLPVIPVLLPGSSDIPQEALFLRELNYVRFVGGLDDEQALDRLVWGITGQKPVGSGTAIFGAGMGTQP